MTDPAQIDRPTPAPALPSRGRLRPLGLDEVTITGGFWSDRQSVNGGQTLAHILYWMEREGWVANFDLAARGGLPEGRRGREFSDSEVYKLLESMSWEIHRTGSAALELRFRALVQRVASAQEPDGYLNTYFGRPGQPARWSDLEMGHELYCFGHLIQAAVARARTRPEADDGLLAVAIRSADLLCRSFGETGTAAVCGHPEIETALVELSRLTGKGDYLALAARFVELRGRGLLQEGEWGKDYFQDDMPVREADVLRGHAVRAGYLATGAVDVAVELADAELLTALTTQWENTVARRTYITGGQGSHHQGESFGEDWELPPDRAYSETCAAVASVMFSWRLLLAQGSPRYADLIERTLYNVIATSPSHDGTAFFYTNTLHQRRAGAVPPIDRASPRAASSTRAPWFAVSCCPPNVARTIASLAAYLATVDDTGLQLHQFAPATIRTTLPGGAPLQLEIDTRYPADGVISIRVRDAPRTPWTLALRVPHWATGATLVDRPASGPPQIHPVLPGMATAPRSLLPGDVVELRLPIQPRVVTPDPRIDAVRACVAVERGPEVLCLESLDIASAFGEEPAGSDASLGYLDTTSPRQDSDGIVKALITQARDTSAEDGWPYAPESGRTPAPGSEQAAWVRLIPYHDWGNRGPSTMRVWIPVAPAPGT